MFGNLCQIVLQRAQLNALKTLCLDLDPDSRLTLPKNSYNCGSNFTLLQPQDHYHTKLAGQELEVIHDEFNVSQIRRWGRLKLSNGLVARSIFSEKGRRGNMRISRNVKVKLFIDYCNFLLILS